MLQALQQQGHLRMRRLGWALHSRHCRHPELADELAIFLALAALGEPMGYPKLAKLHHQRLGTFKSDHSRAVSGDILAIHWALDAVMDRISKGTELWRQRIAELG